MPNQKTLVQTIEARDLEDNSTLRAEIYSCTELGNRGVPGIQVTFMGNFVNYEPLIVEQWAYQARKKGVETYLLEDHSWTVHQDQYVKCYLVTGTPLKARVEVKTRSASKPKVAEADLPFTLEDE